jgi:hypothetical protein
MASFHSGTDDSGEEHSLCNTVFARQSLITVFGPCVDNTVTTLALDPLPAKHGPFAEREARTHGRCLVPVVSAAQTFTFCCSGRCGRKGSRGINCACPAPICACGTQLHMW